MKFTAAFVIYNPNSTGPSKQLAEECAAGLRHASPKTEVMLVPTEYAGHAEKLAYDFATQSSTPLIISSSGDGGYHEVVNGILRAENEGHPAVAGLLPGGNANDHFNALHHTDLIRRAVKEEIQAIDVLKLQGTSSGKPLIRYAHSYIGLGLTPHVGKELTKAKLNRINELAIVAKSLMSTHGVRLEINGKRRAFRSVVVTNIGRMAKVLNLADEAKPDDGQFEINLIEQRSRLHLLGRLLHASTLGLDSTAQADVFKFRTIRPTLVQLDGEVIRLDARTPVIISIEPHKLQCIV